MNTMLDVMLECKEISENIKPYLKETDLILCLGYCYGEFSYYFENKVIGFDIIEKPFTFKKDIDILINKAVVGDNKDYVYVKSNFDICDKVTNYETDKKVECVRFDDVINLYKPDVLRIDVEGSEWDYDFSCINENCRVISLEQHYNEKMTYGNYIDLSKYGFILVKREDIPYTYIKKEGVACTELLWVKI